MADRKNVQDIYPLTPLQEGMLYQSLVYAGSSVYHQQMRVELEGALDPHLLEQAWQRIVQRHDVFRTVFVQGNTPRPMQVVLRERPFALQLVNLDALDADAAEAEIDRQMADDRATPFNLARDLPLRVKLFRRGESTWTLLLSFHHIVMDGWCFPILLKELHQIYAALENGHDPRLHPPVPFGRFVQWLEKQPHAKSLAWWREELAGLEHISPFPTTHPRPDASSQYELRRFTMALSEQDTGALRTLARDAGVTLNHLLRALWGVLLERHGNGEDVIFGATVAGRPPELQGVEKTIGMFINTLPVRLRLKSDSTFLDLLQQVRVHSLALDRHQYVSLADIQAQSPLRHGLFDHILIFENVPDSGSDPEADELVPGVRALSSSTFEQTPYPLEVTVFPGKRLNVRFAFNATHFTTDDIKRLAERFERLVHSLLANPSIPLAEIEALPLEEAVFLEDQGTGPVPEGARQGSIPALFEEQVRQHPDAIAVRSGKRSLTFREVDRASGAIARALLGDGPLEHEERVGLLLHRGLQLPSAMLGVLRAGAAYVPVDPSFPAERVRTMLQRAGVRKVLVDDAAPWTWLEDELGISLLTLEQVLQGDGEPAPLPAVQPDNLAYVIFTSGSTGEPKGVMVTHGNVTSFAKNLPDVFGIGPGDVLYAVTTFTFDISVLELICSLLNGVTVVVASREAATEPARILEEMADTESTVLQMTPSHISMIAEGLYLLPDLRVVLVGGEPMPLDLQEVLCDLPMRRVFNVYGPTETTIWSTAKELEHNRHTIGKPLPGEMVRILDAKGRPAPIGVEGEIWIGGAGVTRGYIGHPELTGARFAPDPQHPGQALYRTGDRGRWLPSGEIDYRGRVDNQVKVRGFRIEPEEIEHRLAALEGVLEAAVIAMDDGNDSRALSAFVTGFNRLDTVALRAALEDLLPAYMVPGRITQLDSLPLNPSGKVDRAALARMEQDGTHSGTAGDPPRDEMESGIARAWCEVLNLESVGIHDHFIDLGGHSLKAMQLAAKLQKAGYRVRVGDVLKAGTIAELARRLRKQQTSGLPDIPRLQPGTPAPLSHSQRRLWVLEKMMDSARSVYILPSASLLRGPLDFGALERALQELTRRHASLRTRFVEVEGAPRQLVEATAEVHLGVTDLSSASDPRAAALEQIAERLSQPFDLTHAPLFEARLFRLGADEHLLFTRMHHIITDGSSMAILDRELRELYNGFRAGHRTDLEPLPVQYGDFAAWQETLLEGDTGAKDRDYWLKQLDGFAPVDLPQDRPRPPVQDFSGDTIDLLFTPGEVHLFEERARKAHTTLFTLLAASLALFLKRITGSDDIVLGTPVSGRVHPDLEGVVGFFANTLPLRVAMKRGESSGDLLTRVSEVIRDAQEHALYPFDRLVDDLRLPRDMSRPPLLSVMLVLDQETSAGGEFRELEVEPQRLSATTSRFDLTLELVHQPDGSLRAGLNYATALFDRRTVERWSRWLKHLANELASTPDAMVDALDVLDEAERRQMLQVDHPSSPPFSVGEHIADGFEAAVDRYPGNTALEVGDRRWSYLDLDREANRIAHALQGAGVEKGDTVVSFHDRSPEAVIATLGILKAGGLLLPIRPGDPSERVRAMVQDASCRYGITLPAFSSALKAAGVEYVLMPDHWASAAEDRVCDERAGSDLAYLIYTSGSTGRPKGVLVEHGGFVNMSREQIRHFGVTPGDRVLLFASPTFDASMSEMFMALLTGATLLPVDEATVADPDRFGSFIEDGGISVATLPPPFLALQRRESVSKLRVLITAGEAPRSKNVEYYRSRVRYFNAYGPTEASVCTTIQPVHEELNLERGIPMGRPIHGMRVYLLDDRLRPVGTGVRGEIWIGGYGLARGYLNRPDESAARFIDDPFLPGERIYRSGDLACWTSEGALLFQGRADEQLKVRGQRVEPAEVRHHLLALPWVNDAAVLPFPSAQAPVGLVAYVAGSNGSDVADVKAWLRSRVPESMVPGHILFLDHLPLNAHGKLDRAALPSFHDSAADNRSAARPEDELTRELLGICRELPGLEGIGLHDPFFEAGGNSLTAIQFAARISSRFERTVAVKQLFLHPTISELADAIRQGDGTMSQGATGLQATRPSNGKPHPSVSLVDESLLEAFQKGRIGRVDAAAIGYFTEEMLQASGMTHEAFLAHAGTSPILSNIIRSPRGSIAFFTLPRFTGGMYEDRDGLIEHLGQTFELASTLGAKAVSLTGLIPSAIRYGADLKPLLDAHPEWPVMTTGHATTAATVLLAVERVLEDSGRSLGREVVGLLGLGSVGSSLLRLMLASSPHPNQVVLCDLGSQRKHMEALAEEARDRFGFSGDIEILTSETGVPEAFYAASLIVGATNIADILAVDRLQPGALVVDDSGPHCFSEQDAIDRFEQQGDVLFMEGGGLSQADPFTVQAYLPPFLKDMLAKAGIVPYRDFNPHEITGCVYSSLLTAKFPGLPATVGLPGVEEMQAHLDALHRWGMVASTPRIGGYLLDPHRVENFKQRFRSLGEAAAKQ